MAETIILDPTESVSGRTQFDITPWVKSDGVDWGDGAITAYMAQAQRGEVPVDYRIPNRTITMPLSIRNVGGTAFATARNMIQAKAAQFQTEGGWLKRVASSGGTAYLDVVNATLHLGGGWSQAAKDYDVDATLTLEATPDFYGNEVDLGDNTTTSSHIIFTETGIAGNYPARTRIVVDDDQPVSRLGLMWAVRSKNYSSSAANGIYFPASELTAMDTAIGTNWTPLFSTSRDSGSAPLGNLVHQGTYRIWMGVTVTTYIIDFRLVWDVGDMTLPVENAPVTPTTSRAGGTFMVDLGEVRLDAPPTGTHAWQGQIQARATIPGLTATVRELWVVPVDEGYGVLRASLNSNIGMAIYSARDEFNQSAGALAGKTAPVGGIWSGSGDADDFQVDATNDWITRTAVSDSADTNGRYDRLPVTMTSCAVQADFKRSVATATVTTFHKVFARYVDTSNHVSFGMLDDGTLGVETLVAGVTSRLGSVEVSISTDVWYTLRLAVDTQGNFQAWFGPQGSQGSLVASGTSTVLATGGTLASGHIGLYDAQTAATAHTRYYDNFAAWVPLADAVIFSGQSLEMRTEGIFREDSAGLGAYGPVSNVVGDMPRLPPATVDSRVCQFFINTSRGDFGQLQDATRTDDISVRAFYRPSWLTVPG